MPWSSNHRREILSVAGRALLQRLRKGLAQPAVSMAIGWIHLAIPIASHRNWWDIGGQLWEADWRRSLSSYSRSIPLTRFSLAGVVSASQEIAAGAAYSWSRARRGKMFAGVGASVTSLNSAAAADILEMSPTLERIRREIRPRAGLSSPSVIDQREGAEAGETITVVPLPAAPVAPVRPVAPS